LTISRRCFFHDLN